MFFDHFGIVPDRPDRETLRTILSYFSNIPWENLTKFLRKTQNLPAENLLRLAETVISEHIEKGAGGTCFSLTEALAAVLSSAGYRCHPVMADMSHGKNIHCALSVTTGNGTLFLADPGYLVPVPVLLEPGKVSEIRISGQTLTWEPSEDGSTYDLYTVDGDEKKWRYRVRLDQIGSMEFRNHWQKSFDDTGMNSLHLNRRNDGERLSAHNLNLRRVNPEGKKNEKLVEAYPEKIETYFGLSRDIARAAEREWKKSCQGR